MRCGIAAAHSCRRRLAAPGVAGIAIGWSAAALLAPALALCRGSPLGTVPAAGAAELPHVYNDGGMIGFGSVGLTAPDHAPTARTRRSSPAWPPPTATATCWPARDGGVFAFGDANFEGSAGSLPLQGPIVAMAVDARRQGLLAGRARRRRLRLRRRRLLRLHGRHPPEPADRRHGGDARRQGATGWWRPTAASSPTATPASTAAPAASALNEPIVGMAATHDGKGYWLVAADGGIFNYGDAAFYGSAGGDNLPDWVVGMVASPDGGGYLMATANGVVLPFGDAAGRSAGSPLNPTATQISAIIGNNQGTGYWLLDPQAWQYSFSTTTPEPMLPRSDHHRRRGWPRRSSPTRTPRGPTATRTAPARSGARCSPPGSGEQAGIPIPSYAFTGDIYDWAAAHGAVLPPTAVPAVGDAVLYGTGPRAPRPRCMSGS